MQVCDVQILGNWIFLFGDFELVRKVRWQTRLFFRYKVGWGGSTQNSHAAQGLGSALGETVKPAVLSRRLVNHNFGKTTRKTKKKTKRHTTSKNQKKKKHCK